MREAAIKGRNVFDTSKILLNIPSEDDLYDARTYGLEVDEKWYYIKKGIENNSDKIWRDFNIQTDRVLEFTKSCHTLIDKETRTFIPIAVAIFSDNKVKKNDKLKNTSRLKLSEYGTFNLRSFQFLYHSTHELREKQFFACGSYDLIEKKNT